MVRPSWRPQAPYRQISKQRLIGRTMLAVGDNEEATRLMGLSVRKAKALAYMISYSCAGPFWPLASALISPLQASAGS